MIEPLNARIASSSGERRVRPHDGREPIGEEVDHMLQPRSIPAMTSRIPAITINTLLQPHPG
jgi:hypothetical protein